MKPPIIRLLKDPTPFLKFDPLHSTEKCISKEGPTCKLLQQVSKSTAAALFLHGTLVYNLHNVLKMTCIILHTCATEVNTLS